MALAEKTSEKTTLSERAIWRSPKLGTKRLLTTSAGLLPVYERGAGDRTLVFAHGWLANANLWRNVVDALAGSLADALAGEFRTIVFDLPLGAHPAAMTAGADLTPDGIGNLIQEAWAELDVRDAVMIGNDSGGAYTQIALSKDASRAAGLVLNACEVPGISWPPKGFEGLQAAARTPGRLRAAMTPLRNPALRMAEAAFGRLVQKPIEEEASNTYVLPLLDDDGVLRDAEAVISSGAGIHVEQAAAKLIAGFDRPVALIWPAEDKIFLHENAIAYANALRHGRYETLPGCRSFVPEDQPVALAQRISVFARTL